MDLNKFFFSRISFIFHVKKAEKTRTLIKETNLFAKHPVE